MLKLGRLSCACSAFGLLFVADEQQHQHQKDANKADGVPHGKGGTEHQRADDGRRNRFRKAEQAGFLRPNVLDAAHVTAERQHVADEHDRRNTGNAGRVGYVVHPPRAEHQRKEGAAHQECPTLQHGCGVLFLQVFGPYGVNNNAERADNTNDQRSGRNRHVGQAAAV